MPVRANEYPTAAIRPANSVLDTSAAEHVFGLTLRPWQDALAATLAWPLPGYASARAVAA